MLRRLLALALLLAAARPLLARDHQAERRAQAAEALQKYLDATFRGADWKQVSQYVLWDPEPEPACLELVRSSSISELHLRARDRAVATVIFYRLGRYCPREAAFTPRPGLEKVVYQLRRRSIAWLVEKTNRPGVNVDWQVVRGRLQQRIADPATPVAETAKLAAALQQLERTAAVVGKAPGEARRQQ